ncbi:MAG: hypothetical protein WCO75_07710 [Planctomycetota bacterium]
MTATDRTTAGGTCHVFHAFEAGFSVDIESAARSVAGAGRIGLATSDRNVAGADFESRPLRVSIEMAPIRLEHFEVMPRAHVTIFHFGAMSVRIDIALNGPAHALPELARTLVSQSALRDAARTVAQDMIGVLGNAIVRPALSARCEDYMVFALLPNGDDLRAGLPDELLARILRAEEGVLAPEQVRDAVSACTSYGNDDLTVIDWNGAVIVDRTPDDALSVLEFANVELIEMRWLDDRLDDALEEAFRTAGQSMRGARILSVQTGRHTRRIAELQIDAAALFESVNNALKLFGDQWLARLHQSATHRLHIDDYERSVLRKLEALDSIYEKLRDRQVQIRAELLELVVIVLIALEMFVLMRS